MKLKIKDLEVEVSAKEAEEIKKQLNTVEEEEWPKKGDKYLYACGCCGVPFYRTYKNDDVDKYHQKVGNTFRTEKEVELYKKRLESMEIGRKKKFEEGEEVWVWHFKNKKPDVYFYSKCILPDKLIGAMHKTKEEVNKWHDEFGEAWEN